MKHLFVIGLGVLMIVFTLGGSGSAEIIPGAWSISPMVGSFNFEPDPTDPDLEVDKEEFPDMFSLGIGYNITESFTLEGLFSYMQPESDVGLGDIDVYRYELDLLVHLAPDNMFVPYIAAGLGALSFNPDKGSSETQALGNVGLGFNFFILPRFAIRADARYMMGVDGLGDVGDEGKDIHWSWAFGGTLVFGGETEEEILPEPEPAPAPPPPVDSDGDGVIDARDQCPNTPVGVAVDEDGCPLDSDGDGVPDDQDQCPNTPEGVAVDEDGCPIDSDGDGVPDNLDKCPGTPEGATVDECGCWVIDATVLFDFDKASLRPEASDELDNVYDILTRQEDMALEIRGHTDSIGPAEYNQMLSKRRAQSVKDYLLEKGIAGDRLITVGYGEEKPTAPNDTEAGRQKNRRVELTPITEVPVE
ncbi:MAG: OmpA family protein [Desulfobacterales bacterium]